MATLIIITAWAGYGVAMYLAMYIYNCAWTGAKLNGFHVIRIIALSVVIMAICSALAATYPRRVKYVESGHIPEYTDGVNQQSGLDSTVH